MAVKKAAPKVVKKSVAKKAPISLPAKKMPTKKAAPERTSKPTSKKHQWRDGLTPFVVKQDVARGVTLKEFEVQFDGRCAVTATLHVFAVDIDTADSLALDAVNYQGLPSSCLTYGRARLEEESTFVEEIQ